MTRPLLQGSICAALVLLACAAAYAEERVEGDGYRLRIPGGYRRVPLAECGT